VVRHFGTELGTPKPAVFGLEAAAAWFQKAADQGYANAQAYLGYSYRYGLGVPKAKLVCFAMTWKMTGEQLARERNSSAIGSLSNRLCEMCPRPQSVRTFAVAP